MSDTVKRKGGGEILMLYGPVDKEERERERRWFIKGSERERGPFSQSGELLEARRAVSGHLILLSSSS